MAENKPEVVAFRNLATGKVWAVNPGTPAHARMVKGLAAGDYETASLEKSKRTRAKSGSESE